MYHDLLIHVDLADQQHFHIALNNARFYLDALPDEQFSVVILANAGAVRHLLRDAPLAEDIRALADRGVIFTACANALRLHQITPDMLLEGIDIVPAGVVELVRLQREGFAYVKP